MALLICLSASRLRYSHEDYADRHGSFWHNHQGQWFYASNDRSHSTDLAHRDVFRDTVVGYVHYYENRSIAPVVIDSTGVGEYRAQHIEAENFMRLCGSARKQHLPDRADAFVVTVADAVDTALHYPHVLGAGGHNVTTLVLVAANPRSTVATVLARRASADGPVLGECTVAPSGGEFSAHTACALALTDSDAGGLDLVLTFAGDRLALQIDYFAVVATVRS